ncbi:hypothetical protein [Micromonospora sp. SL4-19]|uniref:hypothetical protein n=1 Tax=Micromonospora sp. SL4-19 TaxID=3399129 RepID=UPI003A4E4270
MRWADIQGITVLGQRRTGVIAPTGAARAIADRDWRTGRIGEWFRVYRPDLMP